MNLSTNFDQEKSLWNVYLNDLRILAYGYGEEDDPNPSFHVVKTIEGHQLTLYRPWDHPWHNGLFFSWKYINKFNFWEAIYHGENNVVVTDMFTPFENEEIGFNQKLSYITYEGDKLLNENRTVQIQSESQGYLIHWKSSFFTENGSITLESSENTERTPWGGYGGLSCRLNRNFLSPVITTDLGVYSANDAFAKPFKWCDYSGQLDGFTKERWAGICIMDHPSNQRFPSPKLTYDYKDMQFISSAMLFNQPYVLNEGEELSLNYSFYIHDGAANKEELGKIWGKISQ